MWQMQEELRQKAGQNFWGDVFHNSTLKQVVMAHVLNADALNEVCGVDLVRTAFGRRLVVFHGPS